jgi:hypothetical protein
VHADEAAISSGGATGVIQPIGYARDALVHRGDLSQDIGGYSQRLLGPGQSHLIVSVYHAVLPGDHLFNALILGEDLGIGDLAVVERLALNFEESGVAAPYDQRDCDEHRYDESVQEQERNVHDLPDGKVRQRAKGLGLS